MPHKSEIKAERELPADSHTPDSLSAMNIIFHTSFIYYPPRRPTVSELTHSFTLREGIGAWHKDAGLSPLSSPCPSSYRVDTLTAQCDINIFLKELTNTPLGNLTHFRRPDLGVLHKIAQESRSISLRRIYCVSEGSGRSEASRQDEKSPDICSCVLHLKF